MKTLYEITRERQEAEAILDEIMALEEQTEYDVQRASELMSKLEITEDELQAKSLAYVHIMRETEAGIELARSERKRLSEAMARQERVIKTLSKNLIHAMETFGLKEIKTGTYRISTRRSKSLEILDPSGVPHEFASIKEEVVPDKLKIKRRLTELQQALEEGNLSDSDASELEKILGFAMIQENKNIAVY